MGGAFAGFAVGVLMGLLSGTVALVLLKKVNTAPVDNVSAVMKLVAELLAMPAFWFSGPLFSSEILPFDLPEIINSYVFAVAITFALIVAYPLFRWIVQLGVELGQGQG